MGNPKAIVRFSFFANCHMINQIEVLAGAGKAP